LLYIEKVRKASKLSTAAQIAALKEDGLALGIEFLIVFRGLFFHFAHGLPSYSSAAADGGVYRLSEEAKH
jgi:hypothetical protein